MFLILTGCTDLLSNDPAGAGSSLVKIQVTSPNSSDSIGYTGEDKDAFDLVKNYLVKLGIKDFILVGSGKGGNLTVCKAAVSKHNKDGCVWE